jgi:bifunctional non-homologous end joining protein LigD
MKHAPTRSEPDVAAGAPDPMLATLVDEPFSDPDWVFEPKYDGIRAIAEIRGTTLTLRTRTGHDVTARYPELAALPRRVRGNAVLDGEIVSLDPEGRSNFQRLQQRIGLQGARDIAGKAKEDPAVFAVFDVLARGSEDLRALPLSRRRELLEKLVRPGGPLLLSPQTDGDGTGLFRKAVRQGWEGIIAKRKSSPYRAGRSEDWLKIKRVRRQEVVIGGWTDPRRTRPLLGALVVGLYGKDGMLHWVGNVGGGFTRKSLAQVHRLLQPLGRGESPFDGPVRAREVVHWVEPRLVAEVTFGEWTRDGQMRIPIFQGLRDDKKPEDCRLERKERTGAVVRQGAARRPSGLGDYRAKRDFSRTREPAGRVQPARGALRFVVQEHHASVLHYDFRLEMAGVLKSWSVPKGPSLDPSVMRLAVQVEDHPVDYLTFTGSIPEGSYGGGQVYRWDIGTYEPLDADPTAAWDAGVLKFRLAGERLRGEWRLVRTKFAMSHHKPSWLLFKVRDEEARPGHRADRIGMVAPARRRAPARTATPPKRSASRSGKGAIPLEEFEALASPSGEWTVDVEGTPVRLTHLERVYWPEERITKFELLRYYIRAWPRMRRFLEGRPGILHRHPSGLRGPSFFQHNLEDVPDYVTTRTLESREGRSIDYVVYDTLASLLYLTNLGTLEHHPWHSTLEHLDRPDWLALDLDPGNAGWDEVLRVALAVRDALQRRGLPGYPKTSGSRGIHVYVPIEPRTSYEDVSERAREIAGEVVEAVPGIATVERRKSARGKSSIYVDWLQNARGKTMAAPWTVRARPGATISMPLDWASVEKGARIESFWLRTVDVGSTTGWEDFFERRRRLT